MSTATNNPPNNSAPAITARSVRVPPGVIGPVCQPYPLSARPDYSIHVTTALKEQRKSLPDAPGVYLFRDEKGKVIYVGKANSVRKRVASHFAGKSSTRGAADMISRIANIE